MLKRLVLSVPAHLRGQVAQAAGLAALVTLFWRRVSPLAPSPPCCDAGEYLRMAADPGQTVARPYSTRLLVPWLVHLLGTDPQRTYHAVSLVCLSAAGLLLYLLVRHFGPGHGTALLAMAALLSSRGWLFYLYDPYLSDPAAFLLLAACFLVLVRARPTWLVAPLLVLMAGTRELFAGFLLPLYQRLRRRRLDPMAALASLALLLPAAIAYAAVLKLAPSRPSVEYSNSYGAVLSDILHTRMREDGGLWPGSAFAMSLGAWWPLAVASWRSAPVRRLGWWLVPVFGNCLIGWDWSRYLLYAFPIVMTAGAVTLARTKYRRWLLGLVGIQALLPLLDFAVGRPQLNHAGPSLPLGLLLIGVVTFILVLERVQEEQGLRLIAGGVRGGRATKIRSRRAGARPREGA